MTIARIMTEWHSFAGAVMPPDVHRVQVMEMRRAFFAGARAMLTLATELVAEDIGEDAGADVLQEISEELSEFSRRVGTGDY